MSFGRAASTGRHWTALRWANFCQGPSEALAWASADGCVTQRGEGQEDLMRGYAWSYKAFYFHPNNPLLAGLMSPWHLQGLSPVAFVFLLYAAGSWLCMGRKNRSATILHISLARPRLKNGRCISERWYVLPKWRRLLCYGRYCIQLHLRISTVAIGDESEGHLETAQASR